MALTQVDQGLLGQYAQYTGFKNRIINGGMVIDQRNAGASASISSGVNAYTLDRWRAWSYTGGSITIQQSSVAPAGFTNSLLWTVSTTDASLSSGDYYILAQYIEGYNVADLGWGAAGASAVTLSFWVRSSVTGTFGGTLSNSAQNRSYAFTYAINAANTWEQKTITIPGDTSGTWLKTNGIGLEVYFGLGVGSTYSGAAGAWAGAAYLSATGGTNLMATSGATFYITGVQLEVGSTATSFDYRPYGTELALCQRYYREFGTSTSRYIVSSNVTTSSTYYWTVLLNPYMRTGPTVTISDESNNNIAPAAITESAQDKFWLYGLASATGRGYIQCKLTASAEL